MQIVRSISTPGFWSLISNIPTKAIFLAVVARWEAVEGSSVDL